GTSQHKGEVEVFAGRAEEPAPAAPAARRLLFGEHERAVRGALVRLAARQAHRRIDGGTVEEEAADGPRAQRRMKSGGIKGAHGGNDPSARSGRLARRPRETMKRAGRS